MNKIVVVICIFTIAFISFTVGYKYGDSRGYSDGFDSGYSFDCRPQIDSMIHRADSIYKVMDFLSRECQVTAVENHKMRYEKRADSIRNATGREVPSFDSAVKRSQELTRETLREARGLK